METPDPNTPATTGSATGLKRRNRAWTYFVLAAAVVGLGVAGVHRYNEDRDSERDAAQARAEVKAKELKRTFAAAGLPLYGDVIQVSRTLGTDGGAICEAPDRALALGFLKLQASAGAARPDRRAVAVARQELRGERLVVRAYCPDKVSVLRNLLGRLRAGGTSR